MLCDTKKQQKTTQSLSSPSLSVFIKTKYYWKYFVNWCHSKKYSFRYGKSSKPLFTSFSFLAMFDIGWGILLQQNYMSTKRNKRMNVYHIPGETN